ncbi:MAG: hypothetical protein Q9191_002057 [Dirinaria sp. TL-2023a]
MIRSKRRSRVLRDGQHQLVKPYYSYFKYDSDLAPTNATANDRFVQLRLDCPLTPEEYWYDKKVEEVLYPSYKSIDRLFFPNAARVEILEHAISKDPKTEGFNRLIDRSQVRKRHPRWLTENIERHELKTDQPSDFVHVVDYASQATAMDVVTRNFANENTRIYFDEKHKWYYCHGLQADEVIAFVQADSEAENRAGIVDFTHIF